MIQFVPKGSECAVGSFSERLKELREKRGLTQDELAVQLGVARSTIGGYEAPSKQREPEFEVVGRLAAFFNVSVDYLLGRADNPNPRVDQGPTPAAILDSPQSVLPAWLQQLPPDMQKFVEEESKNGWPYLRLARGLKMQDLTKEELEAIVATWMDAKRRNEKEFGK